MPGTVGRAVGGGASQATTAEFGHQCRNWNVSATEIVDVIRHSRQCRSTELAG